MTSNTQGKPTILFPLFIVIFVNGLKNFYEDRVRVNLDKQENSKKVCNLTLKDSESRWEDIRPGDLIKIKRDEYFPCDLILIFSTQINGIACVETKSLDGETNLKSKNSVMKVLRYLQLDANNIYSLNGTLNLEEPNALMHNFKGSLYVQTEGLESHHLSRSSANLQINLNSNICSLDFNNFLMRGSSLKNVDYIIGIAAYTGHNTKIMKNSVEAKEKSSHLTVKLNKLLRIIVVLLFSSCLFLSLVSYLYDISQLKENNNLNMIDEIFLNFFRWLLNLYNIIPVSIIVTIEMCRYGQGFLIDWDTDMYNKSLKMYASAQTSSLVEELGQVEVSL